MTSQAPSPFAWPLLIGAASFFFPALGAWIAGRSLRRDAAGQIAGVLLLVGLGGWLGLGQALHVFPRTIAISTFNTTLAPVLLLAPLLSWLGNSAARWRRTAQLVALTMIVVAALALGTGREFRLVTNPIINFGMTMLTAVVLTRNVRGGDASAPVRLPILGGLFMYYFTAMVSVPLIETLVGSDPRAVIDAHMGVQLVYAGCMTVIAWGVSRRPAPAPVFPAGPEPSRAPAPAYAPPVVAPPDAYPEPKRPAAQRQAI